MKLKVTKVGEHGLQLTRFGLVNCYLVRESDGFTLIDANLAGLGVDIAEAAAAAGGPVRRIALTHAHVDHVGSVDELVARLPGVALAASERSLPLLRQPPDKTLRADEPQKSFSGGLPGIKSAVTHLLAAGELFGSLRVIATPGHIPGHVAFLDERDGTLYAGDELVCVGRLSVCGYTPWYFSLPSLVMWSKELAVESARHLLAYPVERFAAGHGPVRGGGLAALRGALALAGGA